MTPLFLISINFVFMIYYTHHGFYLGLRGEGSSLRGLFGGWWWGRHEWWALSTHKVPSPFPPVTSFHQSSTPEQGTKPRFLSPPGGRSQNKHRLISEPAIFLKRCSLEVSKKKKTFPKASQPEDLGGGLQGNLKRSRTAGWTDEFPSASLPPPNIAG